MAYDKTESDYFEMRNPEYVYVSKAFKNSGRFNLEKRFIHKVFEKKEDNKIERVDVEGEYVLRCSPKGKDQVRVLLFQNKGYKSFVLQKFIHNQPQPLSFTFTREEFEDLLDFLEKVDYLDPSIKNRYKIHVDAIGKDQVLIHKDEKEIVETFRNIKGSNRDNLLESLREAKLSENDLNILSGRKKGLEVFRENLFEHSDWTEPNWQDFFSQNTWIFGYGLDYKFLKILQKESSVSDSDLDGKETVISDFLLGTSKFTVLVELKRPDTPLFSNKKNRSRSWTLSTDLTEAVSQILAQKAEWLIKSQKQQYDSYGNPIKQKTRDPKTILVIGDSNQFSGENREMITKAKTFEMYRRNSRNIEILTYTELYERAYFIVNQSQPNL